jgi:hypothetical protein
MPIHEDSGLAELRQVTILLRLLTDTGGTLVQGEAVTMRGDLIGRFRDWTEAARMINAWSAREREAS